MVGDSGSASSSGNEQLWTCCRLSITNVCLINQGTCLWFVPDSRGYNFICPIKTPEDVALPAEPLDALLMELLDAPLVEPEPEVAPAPRRPRRVTQVPRHLSAERDSPITPPNRRARAHTRVARS
ncbi:hypothetical protein OUZ56_016363 [Daphnia magna]|uniref:Uncharacterized protein n=1 Tax=Daphnia magna TaxID=35525 RepID=A0ABR0AQF3_9CRUS|nr:hypothetical protein OUZ56_016363 [Daphnia magna]